MVSGRRWSSNRRGSCSKMTGPSAARDQPFRVRDSLSLAPALPPWPPMAKDNDQSFALDDPASTHIMPGPSRVRIIASSTHFRQLPEYQ